MAVSLIGEAWSVAGAEEAATVVAPCPLELPLGFGSWELRKVHSFANGLESRVHPTSYQVFVYVLVIVVMVGILRLQRENLPCLSICR